MHTLKQNLKLGSLFLATIFVGCSPQFTEETKEGFNLVKNEDGATLGVVSQAYLPPTFSGDFG